MCAIHPPLLAYLPPPQLVAMAIQLDDVVPLVDRFGDILRVKESDAFLPGMGRSDCIEVLMRLRKGTEISKVLSTLESVGYSVGMVKLRGRRLKFVLFENCWRR